MNFNDFTIRNEDVYLHTTLFWQYVVAENIYQIGVNIHNSSNRYVADYNAPVYEGTFNITNVEMVRIRKFEVPEDVTYKIADNLFMPLMELTNYPPDFTIWLDGSCSIKTADELLKLVVGMTLTFIKIEIIK